MIKFFVFVASICISAIFFCSSVYAQSGCCSWHGGVAGCSSGGRQICNDGTLSPSCTCYTPQYIAPIQSYKCTINDKVFYNSVSASNYWYQLVDDAVNDTYKTYLDRNTNQNDIQYWHWKFGFNNCNGSSWNKQDIINQVIKSEEYTKLQENKSQIKPTYSNNFPATQVSFPNKEKRPDYSWAWWLGGIGLFAYFVYKSGK